MAAGAASSRAALALLAAAAVVVAAGAAAAAAAAAAPGELVTVQGGTFVMGYSVLPLPKALSLDEANRQFGDHDETPWRQVTVRTLEFGATEVTNAEYERFDPAHRAMRGRLGFSTGDREAAVFVSWYDAVNYTRWLSSTTGDCYRLPTEAEWEHACRANTTTYFNTGDTFPYGKNQSESWYPAPFRTGPRVVNLTVAEFPPNAAGLYDTHGNVEEWCADWYGRYGGGGGDGDDEVFRVTRGGSHSTEPYFLRSANRAGALPEDRSWVIGFRVVRDASRNASECAAPPLGAHPPRRPAAARGRAPLPPPPVAPLALPAALREERLAARKLRGAATEPRFWEPLEYVLPVNEHRVPITQHNHSPGLAVCANGDVVATFFSTTSEPDRVCAIAASRLRVSQNATAWDPPAVFFDAPDRNDNSPMLWQHGGAGGRLFHVHGMSAAATYGNNAGVAHYSDDCGETWSDPWVVWPSHGLRHSPVNTVVEMLDGTLLLAADNVTIGSGGTALHRSADGGLTWSDDGYLGHDVRGIHGTGVALRNNSLVYYGRGNNITGMMAQSVSDDGGRSWRYTASPFTAVHGGQRASALRLDEGPLVFCGFANVPMRVPCRGGAGSYEVTGLFCALSTDEAASYPQRRVVSDGMLGTVLDGSDEAQFVMGTHQGEPKGYTVLRQGADGTLHLISSRQHYRFNYEWLASTPECPPPLP